jgi:hypothetical protein
MKKYEIDAIRCYQAVMFNKGNETFFATRRINADVALEIEIVEDLKVISVKSERDHILIPLTNVSAIYLKSPIKLEQAENDRIERDRKVTPSIPKRVLVKGIAGR